MGSRILIIEDDSILSDMYAMKFESEGFTVAQANEGLEGLTMIPTFHPDLILLDIMMPGMNGYETLSAIKNQSDYALKILMFTNLSTNQDIQTALSMGADDYLVKANTTPKQAVDKVREMLSGSPITLPTLILQKGQNTFRIVTELQGKDQEIEITLSLKQIIEK